jgi:pimeloyl-ACP methyl ester carboxylesterase
MPLTPGVADLGDVRLHYLEAGDGPLVLCLHGFPDQAPTFRPLLEDLAAAGYTAVAPFMRGYAPSTVQCATYETAALARDVIGLIERLAGGAPAFVVGHDWGGVAAQHAAVLAPDRIRRLVTLAIPHAAAFARALRADPGQLRRSWYEFVFLAEGFAERVVAQDDFAFVDRLVGEWSPGGALEPEEWVAIKRTLGVPGVLRAALEYYRAAFRADRRAPALADDAARWADPVPVATLAVVGADDGCIPPSVSADQAERFTGEYRREVIAGAGHWPHREAPHAVTALVLDWFRS